MSFLKNPTLLAMLKIILAILLGLFVLLSSSIVISIGGFFTLTESKPWFVGFLNHTGMLFFSFIIVSILSRGKISSYGFRITENLRLKETIIVGLIAGFIITGSALILQTSGPPSVEEFSFLQAVVFVWIYASICEEVLTRGLIQGFLSSLRQYGFSIFGSSPI